MQYCCNDYTINYNECDKEYISDLISYFDDRKTDIFKFFGIEKLSKKLIINLYDSIDKYSEYRNYNLSLASVGNMDVLDDNYYLNILSYKEFIKRKGHENDNLDYMFKTLLHEFIHICQEEIDNHATQEGAGLGRIRWKDLTGDGKITEADQTWIYNPVPDFTYGFNIYLEYKNFDFTAFFQGVQGVDIISDLKKETDIWAGLNIGFLNKGKRLLDAWSTTNPDSNVPALSLSDNNNEKRVSSYWVENGSYLKLRTIQFGYNFPQTIASKLAMQRLRMYVSAQNLFTIKSSSFTGVDPENPNYGYPIPLNITFGLNVTF